MRRVIGRVVLAFLFLLAGGAAVGLFQGAGAQSPDHVATNDVVMIRCDANEKTFVVRAYGGSQAAPAKKSDSCPQALSLLKKDGFVVESVGYFDEDDDYIVYTLVR